MREFLLLFLAAVFAPLASAQSLRARLVGAGFSQPTFATAPTGDPLRLFVLEQSGKIRILRNGQIVPTPFLDLGVGGLNKLSSGGERGLLGLAFHPNYATNGYFFVNYTAIGTGATIVERYRVSTNPDVALASSGTVFLTVPQPQNNHNGGMLEFGPDGKLYIGMGDGGGFADTGTGHAPVGNGQALTTLHGKMLRLDVNLPAPHIPPDNPYFGSPSALGEIWHLGLRNPWRFSFDPASGDLYIGDVGESAREEIHYVPAGATNRNFGWRCMEGLVCTGYTGCGCNAPTLTLPVHEYSHNFGCAVVGGYVYRGPALCALQGSYLFADYCSSRVWSCRIVNGQLTQLQDRTPELEPPGGPVSISTIPSLARDGLGEIYVIDADGEIYKIENALIQPDCDADGISDACELAAGAPDCDANGVPDTCQVASGSQTDCDNDGVMDSCEIAGAPTLDWNNNGALDSCECPGGAPPVAYCTAKVNSLGCLPFIQTTGHLSASTEVFFWIGAKKVISQRTGMLIYSYAPNIVPFQGGYWCLATPMQRMPPRNSGGSQTVTNCTGQLPYEFNTYIATGADPALLQVGQEVVFQFWVRDPGASFGSSLTNAVRAAVCQ